MRQATKAELLDRVEKLEKANRDLVGEVERMELEAKRHRASADIMRMKLAAMEAQRDHWAAKAARIVSDYATKGFLHPETVLRKDFYTERLSESGIMLTSPSTQSKGH